MWVYVQTSLCSIQSIVSVKDELFFKSACNFTGMFVGFSERFRLAVQYNIL